MAGRLCASCLATLVKSRAMSTRLDPHANAKPGCAFPQEERLQSLIDKIDAAASEKGGKKRYLYAVRQKDGSIDLKASRRIGMHDAGRRLAMRYEAIDAILREFAHIEAARPIIDEIRALLVNEEKANSFADMTSWRAIFGMARDVVTGKAFRTVKPLHVKLIALQKAARGDGQLNDFLSSTHKRLQTLAEKAGMSVEAITTLHSYLSWKANHAGKSLSQCQLPPSHIARAFAEIDQWVRDHPEAMEDAQFGKPLTMLRREAHQFAQHHPEWAAPAFVLTPADWRSGTVASQVFALSKVVTASASDKGAIVAAAEKLAQKVAAKEGVSDSALLPSAHRCLLDDARCEIERYIRFEAVHNGTNASPEPDDMTDRMDCAIEAFDRGLKKALRIPDPLPSRAGEKWKLQGREYERYSGVQNDQAAHRNAKPTILVPAGGAQDRTHLECHKLHGIDAKHAVLLQNEIAIHKYLSEKQCDAVVALKAVLPGDEPALVFEGRHFGTLTPLLNKLRTSVAGQNQTVGGMVPDAPRASPRAAAQPIMLDATSQQAMLRHIAHGTAEALASLHAAGVAHLHVNTSAIAMLHRPPMRADRRDKSTSTHALPVARLDQLRCATTQETVAILDDVFRKESAKGKAPERLLKQPGRSVVDYLPGPTSVAERFDPKAADVWSFGLLLFDMFHPTGASLFKSNDTAALRKEIALYGRQRAAVLNGDIHAASPFSPIETAHPGLGALIAWILDPNPLLRPTMNQVLARLKEEGFVPLASVPGNGAPAKEKGSQSTGTTRTPAPNVAQLHKFAEQLRRVPVQSGAVGRGNAGKTPQGGIRPQDRTTVSSSDSQEELILDAPVRKSSYATFLTESDDSSSEDSTSSSAADAPPARKKVMKRPRQNIKAGMSGNAVGNSSDILRQVTSIKVNGSPRRADASALPNNNVRLASPSSEGIQSVNVLFQREDSELDDQEKELAELQKMSEPSAQQTGSATPTSFEDESEINATLKEWGVPVDDGESVSEGRAKTSDGTTHTTATREGESAATVGWMREALQGVMEPKETAKLDDYLNAWKSFVADGAYLNPALGRDGTALSDRNSKAVKFAGMFHDAWLTDPRSAPPSIRVVRAEIEAFRQQHPWALDGGLAPYHFHVEGMTLLYQPVLSVIAEIMNDERDQKSPKGMTPEQALAALAKVLKPIAGSVAQTDLLRAYIAGPRAEFKALLQEALMACARTPNDDDFLPLNFTHLGKPATNEEEAAALEAETRRAEELVAIAVDAICDQVDDALPVKYADGQWIRTDQRKTPMKPMSAPAEARTTASADPVLAHVKQRFFTEEGQAFRLVSLRERFKGHPRGLDRYLAIAQKLAGAESDRLKGDPKWVADMHVLHDAKGEPVAMEELPRYGTINQLLPTIFAPLTRLQKIAMLRYLAREIAFSLTWAHNALGVAHRNLSANSVGVFDDDLHPVIRLLDFSSATRARGIEIPERDVSLSARTQRTEGDIGDEAQGHVVDTQAADVWAFGVMLAKMLAPNVPAGDQDGTSRDALATNQRARDEIARELLRVLSDAPGNGVGGDGSKRLEGDEKEVYDFLMLILNPDPSLRPSAGKLVDHPFLDWNKSSLRSVQMKDFKRALADHDVLKDHVKDRPFSPMGKRPPSPPVDLLGTSIIRDTVVVRGGRGTSATKASPTSTTHASITGTTVVNLTSVTGTSVTHGTATNVPPSNLAALNLDLGKTNPDPSIGTGQSPDAFFEEPVEGLNQEGAPTVDAVMAALHGSGSNGDNSATGGTPQRRRKLVPDDRVTQKVPEEHSAAPSPEKTRLQVSAKPGDTSVPSQQPVNVLLPSSLVRNAQLPRPSDSAPSTPSRNEKARTGIGARPKSAGGVAPPRQALNTRGSEKEVLVNSGEYDDISRGGKGRFPLSLSPSKPSPRAKAFAKQQQEARPKKADTPGEEDGVLLSPKGGLSPRAISEKFGIQLKRKKPL